MTVAIQPAAGNGIVVGVVDSLDDPLGLNRVQVQLPYLGGIVSTWARLLTPMAGGGRGLVTRPEVGDEVLLAYEHGDPRRPYVLGALWSQADKPPAGDSERTANNWRFLRSRSGHLVKLDDTPGGERIEIEDKDGLRRIVIDAGGDRIAIAADSGTITIEASKGDVVVRAPSATVNVSSQELVAEATAAARIKAATLTLEASGNVTVEAGGVLTLKGSQVAIN